MGTKSTIIPQIPATNSLKGLDPSVVSFLEKAKESIEISWGKSNRGNPRDRHITLRELPSLIRSDETVMLANAGTVQLADIDESNWLTLKWNEESTANRTLNILVDGADRSITIESDTVLNQDYSSDASPTWASVNIGEDGYVGIGSGSERIVFDGTGGYISVMGAKFGVGTNTPLYSIHAEAASNPYIASKDSTTGVYAAFTAAGGSGAYPRGTFRIGSSVSITNAGLWITPDTASQKLTFVEVMTSIDTSTTSTKRMGLFQNTSLAFIRSASKNGTDAGTDLSIYTYGNDNQLYLKNDGGVGIGTPTIPHGGVGYAKLAIEGTGANAAGAHVQFTTTSDDYPLLQFLNWTHDNVQIAFDAYYDGAWKSSDAGSNFRIIKASDLFRISYDSNISAGDAVTWNDGIVMDASGNVGIESSTLESWDSSCTGLQVGSQWALWGITAEQVSAFGYITHNLYYDGEWKRQVNDEASAYGQSAGGHRFYTVTAGTADTDVAGTLTQLLDLGPTETVFNENQADIDYRIESDTNAYAFFLEGSSGNIGIGSSPTLAKLEVTTSAADQIAYFLNTQATAGNCWGNVISFPNAAPNDTTQYFTLNVDSGGAQSAAWSDGTFASISDISTKKNITPIESVTDKFNLIPVIRFHSLTDDEKAPKRIGIIAQDLELLFPELVSQLDENRKGVNYAGLSPIIIKEVQDIVVRIVELENEVATLKGNLN